VVAGAVVASESDAGVGGLMTITEWDGFEEETKGHRCVFTCAQHPPRFTQRSDSVMVSLALSDRLPHSSVVHPILQALDGQLTELPSPHAARIPMLSPQLPTCQNLFLTPALERLLRHLRETVERLQRRSRRTPLRESASVCARLTAPR
jgi:hypothetical protein